MSGDLEALLLGSPAPLIRSLTRLQESLNTLKLQRETTSLSVLGSSQRLQVQLKNCENGTSCLPDSSLWPPSLARWCCPGRTVFVHRHEICKLSMDLVCIPCTVCRGKLTADTPQYILDRHNCHNHRHACIEEMSAILCPLEKCD